MKMINEELISESTRNDDFRLLSNQFLHLANVTETIRCGCGETWKNIEMCIIYGFISTTKQ